MCLYGGLADAHDAGNFRVAQAALTLEKQGLPATAGQAINGQLNGLGKRGSFGQNIWRVSRIDADAG